MKVLQKVRTLREYLQLIRETRGSDFVLAGTPVHGNIGDQALALAEHAFLKHYFPDKKVAEVKGDAVRKLPGIVLRHMIGKKPVFLQAGGSMGTLYPREENMFRKMVRLFPDNPIVVMPQTISFSDDEEGRRCKEESAAVYNRHRNITFLVREAKSERIVREVLPKVRVFQVPDIVLFLKNRLTVSGTGTGGVAMVMRADKEQSITHEERRKLETLVGRFANGAVSHTDTVVGYNVYRPEREAEVRAKLEEFRQYSLVVTDRLHGMLFGYLAGVRVIAMNNVNGKVKDAYDTIRDCERITFIDNMDQLQDALEQTKQECTDTMRLESRFDRMAELIKGALQGAT